jgi:hypothetical protein
MAVFDYLEGFYNPRRRDSALASSALPTTRGTPSRIRCRPALTRPPKRVNSTNWSQRNAQHVGCGQRH